MRTVRAFMAVAAVVAVIVFSASAAMAVTFNVQVDVGWVISSGTCAEGGTACLGFTGVGGFAGTALNMNWDNQTAAIDSFLRVGALPDTAGFNVGSATTTIDPGQTVRTAQIQHENNPIPEDDNFLGTVTLRTLLTITGPGGEPIIGDGTGGDLDVAVTFLETENQAPCTQTSNTLGSICDDQFTFITIVADIPFTFEGVNYILQVRGLLNPDGTPACEPGAVAGTVNCLTEEEQINDRFVTITLIQVPVVPAPASLLLVGLGLVGAGVLPIIRKRLSA
jgi:hypothetical protein